MPYRRLREFLLLVEPEVCKAFSDRQCRDILFHDFFVVGVSYKVLVNGSEPFKRLRSSARLKRIFSVADRNVPGIAEAMRAASLKITPHAMISRAASVIRGKTLIINLPGSPRACMENMDVFMDTIPHAMGLLRNEVHDCARK